MSDSREGTSDSKEGTSDWLGLGQRKLGSGCLAFLPSEMEEGSPGASEEEWQESCSLLSSHTSGPVGQSWADATHPLPPTPWDTGLSQGIALALCRVPICSLTAT